MVTRQALGIAVCFCWICCIWILTCIHLFG